MSERRVVREVVTVRLKPEEKAELVAEAERDGVTLSVVLYRRLFNDPGAQRRRGRPPHDLRQQEEGLSAAS